MHKATPPSDKLVILLLGYCPSLVATNLPPQIEWSKTHEPVAHMEYYIKAMNEQGHSVVVKVTGLTLLADRAYLGATSNGRVYDPSTALQKWCTRNKVPILY